MSVRFPIRTLIRYAYRLLNTTPKPKYDIRVLSSAVFAIGAASYYARNPPKVIAETYNSVTELDPHTLEFQPCYYEKFLRYASVEVDGVVYMTPADFIKCSSGFGEPRCFGRRVLTQSEAFAAVKTTPSLSHSNSSFFHDLGVSGLISFTEYMFLTSVLTQPKPSLYIAFQMFDKDRNAQVDLNEFLKITKIFSFSSGFEKANYTSGGTKTTLVQHFFGKSGSNKLRFEDFAKFVSNLQIELLRVEFDHFSASQQSLSPSELAQSVLRFARQKPELATKRLETVANSASLAGKTIGFEAYKSLFNFLYVIEDFSSALKMFAIAKHSISKEEFQRAARAVTGSFLDPILVDTLFILFDSDGDGHLSYHEFIETIRARGIAGAQFTSHDSTRFRAFKRCVSKELSQ